MRRILLSISILASLAVAAWLVATGGCSDPTANVVDAGSSDAREVKRIEAAENDLTFVLNGDNTDIQWTGSNSIGQKPTGFFYELDGKAIVDSGSNSLKQLTIDIDMNSVKAMASSLTKKLKHKGFFEVEKFPTATFVSTAIQPVSDQAGYPDANFIVEGNFQLRDVTRSVKLPVKFDVTDDGLRIESKFSINRRDYGVVYSDSMGDKLIRDSVLLELIIAASTKSASVEREVDQQVVGSATPTTRISKLENYTETIKPTLVEFEMVLVPGDKESDIRPFWIGKTEVTWDEFDYWALCKNMSDKSSVKAIDEKLRPSAPHDIEKLYRGWGREGQPVVGISKLSADLYCKWLSKQTGRNYRLPTQSEWNRAYELGGGELDQALSPDELKQVAWFANNALETDEEGFDIERAMPVAQLRPNGLGIHDMLGNAAEWVTTDANQPFVCGGHFKVLAGDLTGNFRESEDQSVWNKDYPQDPKSIWWYVNADYVGFRVVCEPAQASGR